MRIPRDDESGGTIINISSLIDVLFILIIFFMATTTFKEEEMDLAVNLPDSSAPRSISAAAKIVIINVRSAQGRKEGDPIYLVSSFATPLPQRSRRTSIRRFSFAAMSLPSTARSQPRSPHAAKPAYRK